MFIKRDDRGVCVPMCKINKVGTSCDRHHEQNVMDVVNGFWKHLRLR